jgi:hypothetical protein
MSDKSNQPEQNSESGLLPSDWVPKILSVGLLLFLIILVAIVTLAFLGLSEGNVFSDLAVGL